MPIEKKKRGFAAMSPEKLRAISAKGGQKKTAKGFSSKSKETLSEYGRQGSKLRWERARAKRLENESRG